MTNNTPKKVLWWLCLLVAPAVLIAIELFHPAGFTQNPGMYEYLYKPEPYNPQFSALGYFGPQWWFTLHMIQTPMVGLVAVGLWLLADKVGSSEGLAATIFAWLSRVATFVFLIYYTALDSIGGIGLGKTIEITEHGKANLCPQTRVQLSILFIMAEWLEDNGEASHSREAFCEQFASGSNYYFMAAP